MAVNNKVMKVGPGVIKFGENNAGLDFSAEVTEAQIVPSVKKGSNVDVLSGHTVSEPSTYEYKLTATVFQNLTVSGVVGYLHSKAGQVEKLTYTPNAVDGASWSGNVRLDPPTAGGKVGSTDTTKIELDFVEKPVFKPATKVNGLAP